MSRLFPGIQLPSAAAIATPAQAGLQGAEEAFTGASTVGTTGTTGIASGIETGLVGAEEATAGASTLGTVPAAASTGSSFLPGVGAAAGLGMSLFNLAKGNIPAGAGGLAGGAAGAGIGFALGGPPGALIGLGVGSGAGGFLGNIFGGGGNPRDAQRKAAEVNQHLTEAFPALQDDLHLAQTQGDVQQAIDNFTFRVADTGFGFGFAEGHGAGLPFAGILPSPPGGQFDDLVSRFQPVITQLFQRLPKGAAGRVSDWGKAVTGARESERQAKAAAILSNAFVRNGILTGSTGITGPISISGADTADPVIWSDRGRVFAPGFGEGDH